MGELRQADQRGGRTDVRRRRRPELQEIGPGREGVPDDEGVRSPSPHPLPDLHARHYVEMHMREALAPMLIDDEDGPVRDSPVPNAITAPSGHVTVS